MTRSDGPPESFTGRPILVGEVVFDRFPDDSQVLGGAPFNVAWHLKGLGLDPLLVTRVGTDELGDRVVAAMREWHLDTSGVQRDPERSTGEVVIKHHGGPCFDVLPDRAWDAIDDRAALSAVDGVESSLLYHGTLIARTETSHAAVRTLRGETGLPVFLDVNLRTPWWSPAVMRQLLFGTRWLKLNDDELEQVDDGADQDIDPADRLRLLRLRYALDTVLLTRGSSGATVVGADGAIDGIPPRPAKQADTVGAGDAFSAIWIAGLLLGWPIRLTFDRALAFASLICGHRGAIIPDRAVYSNLLEAWADLEFTDLG